MAEEHTVEQASAEAFPKKTAEDAVNAVTPHAAESQSQFEPMAKKVNWHRSEKFNLIAEALAYITTGAATTLTIWSRIRDNFASFVYKNNMWAPVENTPVMRNAIKGLKTMKHPVTGETMVGINDLKDRIGRGGVRDAYIDNLTGTFKGFLGGAEENKAPMTQAFGRVMEGMHVKNSWHKFRCLDKGQQTQVLALGFTVASLGLGAVISWRHNRQLDKRLQEMEEREAEREQNLMSRF